jgi:DNA-binding response OmpR family regulator
MGLFDNIKILSGKKIEEVIPENTYVTPAKKKVLIVEDEKMLSDALAYKLTNSGFTVLTAENGEIGLETAVAQKPDIILLDLMMPIMDGKTMLRKLRDFPQFKTLPVIILTNAGDVHNMMETKTYYNANDFLIKSNITPDLVVKKIRDLV